MGEKGNASLDNPIAALDALPLDAIKGSPETLNAWLDTYLKYREVRETTRAADAAESIADGSATTGDAATGAAATGHATTPGAATTNSSAGQPTDGPPTA